MYINNQKNSAGVMRLLFATFIMLFIANTYSVFGCDMGSAYSVTEMWVEQENLHGYNHASSPAEPIIVANGVVENDYNTCGHEYSAVTTMTLPNGGTVVGAETEIIIDGTYFASTDLKYYCPIIAREIDVEDSSNQFELYGPVNTIYYKYQYREGWLPGLNKCWYKACIDTDQNPPNNCWGPSYIWAWDVVNTSAPCPQSVQNSYQRYRYPLLGISHCVRIDHRDLPFDVCPYGTL